MGDDVAMGEGPPALDEGEPALKRLRGGDDDGNNEAQQQQGAPQAPPPAAVRPFRSMASVVKLFVVQAEPNYAQPWCVSVEVQSAQSWAIILYLQSRQTVAATPQAIRRRLKAMKRCLHDGCLGLGSFASELYSWGVAVT